MASMLPPNRDCPCENELPPILFYASSPKRPCKGLPHLAPETTLPEGQGSALHPSLATCTHAKTPRTIMLYVASRDGHIRVNLAWRKRLFRVIWPLSNVDSA